MHLRTQSPLAAGVADNVNIWALLKEPPFSPQRGQLPSREAKSCCR
mgnify:FL=1|jgi:hypothetical protein